MRTTIRRTGRGRYGSARPRCRRRGSQMRVPRENSLVSMLERRVGTRVRGDAPAPGGGRKVQMRGRSMGSGKSCGPIRVAQAAFPDASTYGTTSASRPSLACFSKTRLSRLPSNTGWKFRPCRRCRPIEERLPDSMSFSEVAIAQLISFLGKTFSRKLVMYSDDASMAMRAFALHVGRFSTAVIAAVSRVRRSGWGRKGYTVFPNAGDGHSVRRDTEQTRSASAAPTRALRITGSSAFFDGALVRVAFVHDVRRAGEEA